MVQQTELNGWNILVKKAIDVETKFQAVARDPQVESSEKASTEDPKPSSRPHSLPHTLRALRMSSPSI